MVYVFRTRGDDVFGWVGWVEVVSNHFLSVYILPGTFLFSLSNCHVFLFSVTRKRNLTDRTGRPAACRVDIGTLPVPLYFSSFPSRMTGAQTYPASDVTRDSQWCLPLTYSISRLLPVCYVGLHTVPCPPRQSWNCLVYLC